MKKTHVGFVPYIHFNAINVYYGFFESILKKSCSANTYNLLLENEVVTVCNTYKICIYMYYSKQLNNYGDLIWYFLKMQELDQLLFRHLSVWRSSKISLSNRFKCQNETVIFSIKCFIKVSALIWSFIGDALWFS